VRVVVETNIFASSFFGGNPRKVIELWRDGRITLCLTPDIVEEYVEVLRRLGVAEQQIEELLRAFASGHSLIFSSRPRRLKVVPSDPDDDKFFECAVALGATVIVTGDKAMLAIGESAGVRAVSPREFLEDFSAAD
jgi:putative PIN family toxin of toxin-antitoxin system